MSSCFTFMHKSKLTNSHTKISNFTFTQVPLIHAFMCKKFQFHVFTTEKRAVHGFTKTTGRASLIDWCFPVWFVPLKMTKTCQKTQNALLRVYGNFTIIFKIMVKFKRIVLTREGMSVKDYSDTFSQIRFTTLNAQTLYFLVFFFQETLYKRH